jgi:uncharacterized protein (DUF1684 family)
MTGSADGEPSELALLELADWRRRLADLYAEVRGEATANPEAAWERWRSVREELFRTHPQSPVPASDRPTFRARHWAYDPSWQFEVEVHVESPVTTEPVGGLSLALPISTGGQESLRRIGWVEVPLAGGAPPLGLFWMSGYAGGLFLPFGDATNGRATYGAGRYLLDAAKSADLGPGRAPGTLVLDFNFAFHPSCAFDSRWSCPLTPTENRLDLPVEAGERLR